MQLVHFHTLRTGVQTNAAPGSARELAGIERQLRKLLLNSGLFESVEVETTDDPDRLVIGLCVFGPAVDEVDVARAIEWLWEEQVRYPYWEAHALHVDRGHVELEAATRAGHGLHYVTVHLVAQQAVVPAQRRPLGDSVGSSPE